MSKRGGREQITKDDYDDDAAGGEVKYGIQRASEDVLKKRRIVRSRRPPTTNSSSAEGGSTAALSSNPFSKINMKPTSGGAGAAKFSFGASTSTSTNTASAAAPKFTFGSAGSSTTTGSTSAAPASSGAPFSFVSKTTTATTSNDNNSHNNSKWKKLYDDEANDQFQKYIASLTGKDLQRDWTEELNAYLRYIESIKADEAAATRSETSGGTTTAISSAGDLGSFAPAPAVPAAAATATTTTTTTMFSTGASSSSSYAPPKQPTNDQEAGGDGEENENSEEESPPPASTADVDPDWEDVKSFDPVLVYRKDKAEGKWVPVGPKGNLRLQRHKNGNGNRMVMKDATKVLVNMSISGSYTKSEVKSKKGAVSGQIGFIGCNNEAQGTIPFMIKCRLQILDDLHSNIEKLAGGGK